MENFSQDINLRKNKIHNGKVSIDDRNSIEDDDIIDKKYVDDVKIYNTALTSNTNVDPIEVGGIVNRTQIHNKPITEVLDNLLYPLTLHSYIKPTISTSINYYNIGTTNTGSREVGALVDIKLTANINYRDSAGLDTNEDPSIEFSGSSISGFIGPTNPSGVDTLIENYTISESNIWKSKVYYLPATVQNDTHGNPDNVGTGANPYFSNGSKESNNSTLTGYWPYWKLEMDGDVPAPNASTIRTLFGSTGKNISSLPSNGRYDLTVTGDNSTKTVFIAIPISGTTVPSITVIKDSALPISSSFTGSLLTGVPDANSTGSTKNYAIYRHTNGVGYGSNSQYQITI